MERSRWYKDAVIYQIYPRSFMDSNGDGVGDIRGIISKLDYIASLGVNAVWLSPIYVSPNDDNGYDIADYRNIQPEFGTLEDFKEMVDGMHKRGIRLIMDLVANHSSDEHEWFKQSRLSKDNPYRDYYIWKKGRGKDGKRPPNNWTSRFGGSAWEYDEATGEWYLHLFSKKQPDLNWNNSKVRQEIADIVKYWIDLGVDGFRCDVITYISKDERYKNGKWHPILRGDEHFTHGPKIHSFLHELNVNGFATGDTMTVGEAAGVTIEQGLLYCDEDREELDTVFTFEHLNADSASTVIPKKFNLAKFKKIFRKWQLGMRGRGWNALYLENHDQPRSVSRYTPRFKEYRVEAAKMLAIALHMLQGTPYVYQGQEIGMLNIKLDNIDDYEDVMIHNIRKIFGVFEPLLRPVIKYCYERLGRDNARTPMQWSPADNAGFTTGKPWFSVNPNYFYINVEDAETDPDSILNFYRDVIAFRKASDIVKYGTYKENHSGSKSIWCYERSWHGERLFVICNFTNREVPFTLPRDAAWSSADLILHNYEHERYLSNMVLSPYEAMVFYLK